MVAAMNAGTCDGFIDAKAYAEWLAHNSAYCNSGLVVGTPLSYGVSNMAIGVNKNLPQVADALSYWVSYYRLCSTTLNSASNLCYGKTNWASLYHESNTYYTCPNSGSTVAPGPTVPSAAVSAAATQITSQSTFNVTVAVLFFVILIFLLVVFTYLKTATNMNRVAAPLASKDTQLVTLEKPSFEQA